MRVIARLELVAEEAEVKEKIGRSEGGMHRARRLVRRLVAK